jgi:hypothetical protein
MSPKEDMNERMQRCDVDVVLSSFQFGTLPTAPDKEKEENKMFGGQAYLPSISIAGQNCQEPQVVDEPAVDAD